MLMILITLSTLLCTDRSETARYLLELPVPADAGVEDNSGQAAITWMVAKMPTVVSNFF